MQFSKIVSHPTMTGVWGSGSSKFTIEEVGSFYFLKQNLPNGMKICAPMNYQGSWYVAQVNEDTRVPERDFQKTFFLQHFLRFHENMFRRYRFLFLRFAFDRMDLE